MHKAKFFFRFSGKKQSSAQNKTDLFYSAAAKKVKLFRRADEHRLNEQRFKTRQQQQQQQQLRRQQQLPLETISYGRFEGILLLLSYLLSFRFDTNRSFALERILQQIQR
jgi:hypothetical protein